MFANTWVAVYRGETVNEYADPTDADTPVVGLERVPAAITEQSRTVFDRETSEARTIRYAVGRINPATGVRQDDRLHDLRSGRWWTVGSTSDPGSTAVGVQALSLELRAV